MIWSMIEILFYYLIMNSKNFKFIETFAKIISKYCVGGFYLNGLHSLIGQKKLGFREKNINDFVESIGER